MEPRQLTYYDANEALAEFERMAVTIAHLEQQAKTANAAVLAAMLGVIEQIEGRYQSKFSSRPSVVEISIVSPECLAEAFREVAAEVRAKAAEGGAL